VSSAMLRREDRSGSPDASGGLPEAIAPDLLAVPETVTDGRQRRLAVLGFLSMLFTILKR